MEKDIKVILVRDYKNKMKGSELLEFQEKDDNKFEKKGYLYDDFKLFHLKDNCKREFQYHYHEFYKVLIIISGNVVYNIEGKSYKLKPYDVVLVNRNMIHKPDVTFG